jgi:hypothetical protein
MKTIVIIVLASFALETTAAEIPKAPIPPSPYLPIIYKFADALLERGRGTNGLFHSALDRTSLSPVTNHFASPSAGRQRQNPQHHQNFLRLLYTLSELSAKPKYRDAADAELRWLIENGDSDHIYLSDRPWMLWDRCFALAPEASKRLAGPPRDHQSQIFPRYAGFCIRTWATAYAHTTNELFLDAIRQPRGHRPQGTHGSEARDSSTGPLIVSGLSFAVDCDAASRLVPEPLASQLRKVADEADRRFCSVSHDLKATGGFASGNDGSLTTEQNTTLWTAKNRAKTTAQIAMMCVSRYENTGNIAYRDLIHAAADAYLNSMPSLDDDIWPMTFGHAISLQVAAWRSTARQEYLDRARAFADFAVKHFFDQGPLPRASLKSNHYEAITGADTLALGLVELHLHILAITAVRYPPNTIDR